MQQIFHESEHKSYMYILRAREHQLDSEIAKQTNLL